MCKRPIPKSLNQPCTTKTYSEINHVQQDVNLNNRVPPTPNTKPLSTVCHQYLLLNLPTNPKKSTMGHQDQPSTHTKLRGTQPPLPSIRNRIHPKDAETQKRGGSRVPPCRR
ncbi:hypothetical protein JTE90_019302 [Oedothorax gibbosus]|uniref:Uncharacterized protein n=1 Tax=Oedothorax gibbosus TaxID=931172 RepID=A0AAV6UYK8_9ARAC|nr:hypothetical protein JTE90_019302 [Oedothorax gibbosus]